MFGGRFVGLGCFEFLDFLFGIDVEKDFLLLAHAFIQLS
jgi:hypothetical protein